MTSTDSNKRSKRGKSAGAFWATFHASGDRRRVYAPKQWPTPTQDDLDLALRDVAEMGWNCATEWSQYVIDWFERR